MLRNVSVVLVVGLFVATGNWCSADDQAVAKGIIERAIKAHGGEEKLAKIKAATWKDKGKYFGMGAEGIEYTAETAAQGPSKRKVTIEGDVEGMKFALIYVVDGNKGWQKMDDEVEDMEQEELDEQKEQMFADWTAFINLSSLKSDAFKLSPLGETKLEDRTLVGVRATSKGHRDLNLYFDKESGLLAKTEWQVKDIEGEAGGGEVQQEAFLSDYKEFGGVKMATKMVVKWAGKTHIESETTDIQFTDKLDETTFNKP